MIDPTRRSFLTMLGSGMASLSAWLARPAYHGGQHQSPEGLTKPPPPPAPPYQKPRPSIPRKAGQWLDEYGDDGEFMRGTHVDCLQFERVIRWIPVTERLPERTETQWKTDSIDGRYSREVLIVSDTGILNIASLIATEWGDEFSVCLDGPSWTLRAITHWAELPSPPEQSA